MGSGRKGTRNLDSVTVICCFSGLRQSGGDPPTGAVHEHWGAIENVLRSKVICEGGVFPPRALFSPFEGVPVILGHMGTGRTPVLLTEYEQARSRREAAPRRLCRRAAVTVVTRGVRVEGEGLP